MFVTLTPNPAIDRVLSLRQALVTEHLHRVAEVWEQAGGKGVNVSRALRALGAQVQTAAVVGGFNGQKFASLLEAEGLSGILEHVEGGETRECQIITGPAGHPTEVYEPGLAYDAAGLQRLLGRLPTARRVVSGSLPPDCSQDDFRALLRDWQPVAVDTSGPALLTALDRGVPLVKPNQSELAAVAGSGDLDAARQVYARTGTTLLVTRGAQGAWLVGQEVWEAIPPALTVSNPVGAGDSTLAGYLWADEQELPAMDRLRWAAATGSTCAVLGGPQHLSRQAIETVLPQIVCLPLDS